MALQRSTQRVVSKKNSLLLLLVTLVLIRSAYILHGLKRLSNDESDLVSYPISPAIFASSTLSNATYDNLVLLESELDSLLNQKVISCRKAFHDGLSACTNPKSTLILYNPSRRDRFVCDTLLPPRGFLRISTENACILGGASLRAHSFPRIPTVGNRDLFPGISIRISPQESIDDTFSSNLGNIALPPNDVTSTKLNDSHGLIFKVQGVKGDGHELWCDVRCAFQSKNGIVGRQYVYGTDWTFEVSIEGEHYYQNLRIDKKAWKENKFYATTSFRSEIPSSYYSIAENWWGNTLQSPAVPFHQGIKGASFLARNCGREREDVVKQLIQSEFRVDSLSSCLHNADPPPDVDIKNKTNVMEKYLFHLSFENGRVDDYITEKLWMAFHAGTIPVVLGAWNVKDHIPFHGAIFVDDFDKVQDLAEYLIKVSNDEELYESYHTWRKEPLPEKFLERYNMTHVHPSCRFCRWSHARKYGLGWSHVKQSIEPVRLPRDTCIESHLLKSPAMETWWDSNGSNPRRLELTPLKNPGTSPCPIANNTIVTATVGDGDLIRSVWSNDGTTDIYVEGRSRRTHILKLQLPLDWHDPIRIFDSHTVFVQNDTSRVSLVLNAEGRGLLDLESMVAAASGMVEVTITSEMLPLRIRVIFEDQDTLHEGATEEPSYYGRIMTEDVLAPPELFESQAESTNLS